MSEASEITNELLVRLFSESERGLIKNFADRIQKIGRAPNDMWEYDKSLGGWGGYAMPTNPTVNLFNRLGGERNLFRSVQYAKSGFLYYTHIPRHIISDAGRSLEWTCKYLLDRFSIVSRLSNNEMLGRSLERLHRKKIISDDLYKSCRLLGGMYNIAKHHISEDDDRTFDIKDGVVAYFTLRKVHNQMLDIIRHPSRSRVYEIYVD